MSKKQTAWLKLAKAVSALLILGTFLFLFVFCVFLPRTTVSNYDTLTSFPEFSWSALFDGSYTAQLGAYFSDTVFMRDTLKGEYYAELKTWFGKETVVITEEGEEEIIIGGINIPSDDPGASDPEASTGGDISLPPDSEEPSGSESSSGGGNSSEPDSPSEEPSQDPGGEDAPPEIIYDSLVILGTRVMEVYYGDPNLNKLHISVSVHLFVILKQNGD